MSSPVVDAVVIGAGPSGLVAANMLADAGWDVVLLEAAATPGGAGRSAEVAATGDAPRSPVVDRRPLPDRHLVGPGRLPAQLLADLRRFRYDRPTVKVDWALREPLPRTNPQTRAAGTVHLGGDTAQLSRTAATVAAARTR